MSDIMLSDLIMVYAGNILRICILIFGGIPLVFWISKLLAALCAKHFSQHIAVLVRNIIFYSGLFLIGVTVLQEFGFNVVTLLGAAGVLGVAIGFASQTTISNVISGFFLLLERSFSVGDIIKSGDVIGYVESIDLLSVHIRSSDNKLIRLPNEVVLKQPLSNLTYYPIKRVDCIISMPYAVDFEHAKTQILQVIENNSLFLKDPVAIILMHKLGQHDLDVEVKMFLMIRVWVATEKFLSAPALLMQQLKDQFDKENIIITIVQGNN
ncbi:MAG TPA: mechanosensitive ion channel family protein [Candidatus Babeliales bacterium]|jgi:small-conductance mechanosensitive channel|nr:mechanosensitive ion channel family protein [Candidatus Babeliales bacterium]